MHPYDQMTHTPIDPLRIDVCALSWSAPTSRRPHLVTRPTGRAVREAIEGRLAAPESSVGRNRRPRALVSLVDFSRVQVMDFSCADEVVAKLLLRYLGSDRPRNAFFLFRAAADTHRHAVEQVLERHRLAAVCDTGEERFCLLGCASPREREVWAVLERRRRIQLGHAGTALDPAGERRLRRLAERRLVYAEAGAVSALSTFAVAGVRQTDGARQAGEGGASVTEGMASVT